MGRASSLRGAVEPPPQPPSPITRTRSLPANPTVLIEFPRERRKGRDRSDPAARGERHLRPGRQKLSADTASFPLRVPIARQVWIAIESLTNFTEPSPNSELTPPG